MNENRRSRPDPAPSHGNGDPLSALTPREREVLRLYAQLLGTKEVARELGTKVQTVRNQLAAIEEKLGIEGREALIAYAVVQRW